MPACASPSCAKRAGIVASVKSPGSQRVDLVPGQRRRHARVGRRPHRVGRGDGAVLGVLVVVEEDAVALLLPPLAGGERRRAPLDLARQRQRGAAHLVEAPAPLDAHVDVHAARARGLGPARPARGRRASRARRAPPRAPAATSRPAPDRGRRAARRDDRGPRRAPDAGAARGRRGSPSRRAPRHRAAPPPRRCGPTESAASTTSIQSGRDCGRALLVEELAVDAVRVAHQHVRPAAGAAQRALGHREVVAHEVELGVPAFGNSTLRGSRSRRGLAAADLRGLAPSEREALGRTS